MKNLDCCKRRTFCIWMAVLLLLSMLSGCGSSGSEETYPNRDITIVVPFSAGGNSDIACRLVGKKLNEFTDENVTILNKPGGGSVIGQTYGAAADPDGYTLTAITSVLVSNVLFADTPYGIDSFIPVSMFSFDPEVVAVSADSGIETLEEFLEAAQTEPLTFATPGYSTANHLAGILMAKKYELNFHYVHNDSASEVAVQLGGGHVTCSLSPYSSLQSMADAGKIKILAVCDEKRHPLLPNVSTMAEMGYDFVYGTWRGLAVPAGTPDEVVETLDNIIATIFDDQEVLDSFEDAGFPVTYMNHEDFYTFIKNECESLKLSLEQGDLDS